jgi:hypothetical protein
MSHSQQINRARFIEKSMRRMRQLAEQSRWINYGTATPHELEPFCHDMTMDGIGVRIIFTRDAGHHTGGWFKNPQYERCYHMSISFRDPSGTILLPQQKRLAGELAHSAYGNNSRLLWIEGPFTSIGRQYDIWHYRLFCDCYWRPILPSKEVYSTEFTEKGWKSFSEIHGHKPNMIQEA